MVGLTHFREPGTGNWVPIEAIDPTKVALNGAVPMTGRLTLSADPTDDLHAATKRYVAAQVGGRRIVTTVSAAQTLPAVAGLDYVYVAGGASAYNLTLPTAVGNTCMYSIKRTATANVTLLTTASQTIDGATSFIIGTRYQSIDLVSDNANWVIL